MSFLQMTRTEVMKNLTKRALPLDVESVLQDSIFHLNFPQYNIRTTLPLTHHEVFLFFAEIEYLRTLVDALKTDQTLRDIAKDSLPDMFSFAFSSLKGIKRVYGPDSDRFKAALYILDSTLTTVVQELSAMYGENKLSVEVVFLGVSASSALNQDLKLRSEVFKVVQADVYSKPTFDAYFPSVYLLDRSAQEAHCFKLQTRISAEYQVHCPSSFVQRSFLDDANTSNGTNPVTSEDAAAFQVILWSAILLIIIIYAAVYALYSMDVGADSMLYRMTGAKHHIS